MNSQVEEIKTKLNIVDIIGQYLRLQKAGSNWKGLCPFHNEKSPSFMVSEEKQIFHCFGCQKGGDVFSFVMEMEGVDFKEALKNLADRAGVELQYKKGAKNEGFDKNKLYEILELATKFYETQLWKGVGRGEILKYLKDRNLSDQSIKDFRLGYAPKGWRNLLSFLTGRGYKTEDILKTGLLVQKNYSDNPQIKNQKLQTANVYDRFRDRIVFPITDIQGRTVGFTGRVAPGGDESQAKYVNTSETALYNKSTILYGINQAKMAIKEADEVVVVEGNVDVIAAHQDGVRQTVAVSGTALTPQQVTILKRYTNTIKLFFDMDTAGQVAALRSAKECLAQGADVQIISISEGKDAADFIKENSGKFGDVVAKSVSALDYFYENIKNENDASSAQGKTKIVEAIADILVGDKNKIEVSHWIKKLSGDLDIEENAVADIIGERKQKAGSYNKSETGNKKKVEEEASRRTIMEERLFGVMLVFPKIWEKVEKDVRRNLLEKNYYLKIAFEKGKTAGYKADQLVGFFPSADIGKIKNIIAKITFDFEDNDSEEKNLAEFEVERLMAAIEKEEYKSELKKVEKEIAEAEKNRDKKRSTELLEKFNLLAQKINI